MEGNNGRGLPGSYIENLLRYGPRCKAQDLGSGDMLRSAIVPTISTFRGKLLPAVNLICSRTAEVEPSILGEEPRDKVGCHASWICLS